jgi:translation elongation factor EF-Ts
MQMTEPHKNPKLINELRQITGVGIMDCKKALYSTKGDIKKAIAYINEHPSSYHTLKTYD